MERFICSRVFPLLLLWLSPGCLTLINTVSEVDSSADTSQQVAEPTPYVSGTIAALTYMYDPDGGAESRAIALDGGFTEHRPQEFLHFEVATDQPYDFSQLDQADFAFAANDELGNPMDTTGLGLKVASGDTAGSQLFQIQLTWGNNPFPNGRYTVTLAEDVSGAQGRFSFNVLQGDMNEDLTVDGDDDQAYLDLLSSDPATLQLDTNMDFTVDPGVDYAQLQAWIAAFPGNSLVGVPIPE